MKRRALLLVALLGLLTRPASLPAAREPGADLWAAGRFAEAYARDRQALREGTLSAPGLLRLGLVALAQGREGLAAGYLESAADAGSAEARAWLGWQAARRGDRAAARRRWRGLEAPEVAAWSRALEADPFPLLAPLDPFSGPVPRGWEGWVEAQRRRIRWLEGSLPPRPFAVEARPPLLPPPPPFPAPAPGASTEAWAAALQADGRLRTAALLWARLGERGRPWFLYDRARLGDPAAYRRLAREASRLSPALRSLAYLLLARLDRARGAEALAWVHLRAAQAHGGSGAPLAWLEGARWLEEAEAFEAAGLAYRQAYRVARGSLRDRVLAAWLDFWLRRGGRRLCTEGPATLVDPLTPDAPLELRRLGARLRARCGDPEGARALLAGIPPEAAPAAWRDLWRAQGDRAALEAWAAEAWVRRLEGWLGLGPRPGDRP